MKLTHEEIMYSWFIARLLVGLVEPYVVEVEEFDPVICDIIGCELVEVTAFGDSRPRYIHARRSPGCIGKTHKEIRYRNV